jgi:hypothetical protein
MNERNLTKYFCNASILALNLHYRKSDIQMKKLFAIIAFIGFVAVKSASAQTAAPQTETKPAVEATKETRMSSSENKDSNCHGMKAASCCKHKEEASKSKKASCCAKHEEKAEAKDEKTKGIKD